MFHQSIFHISANSHIKLGMVMDPIDNLYVSSVLLSETFENWESTEARLTREFHFLSQRYRIILNVYDNTHNTA
jgi:hypothetical protein